MVIFLGKGWGLKGLVPYVFFFKSVCFVDPDIFLLQFNARGGGAQSSSPLKSTMDYGFCKFCLQGLRYVEEGLESKR